MTIKAHPLTWPEGWKRTSHDRRRPGHFGKKVKRPGESWTRTQDLTVNEAVQRVLAELTRWAILRDDIVISTNVPARMDGMPRSDAKKPLDPGAAVYWEESTGERRCIAVDQYTHVEDNLAAIAATLDAMRAIERHGGAEILQRAFTGFTALAAPTSTRSWWDVLRVPKQSTREAVKTAYRALASKAHPDKPGGSHEAMAELNAAQEAALLECTE